MNPPPGSFGFWGFPAQEVVMKKCLAIAVLLLASTAAQAQYTFDYGGRTITIDPDRGTVSIPGVYDNTGKKAKRSRSEDGDPDRPGKKAPQQAKTAPQAAPETATPPHLHRLNRLPLRRRHPRLRPLLRPLQHQLRLRGVKLRARRRPLPPRVPLRPRPNCSRALRRSNRHLLRLPRHSPLLPRRNRPRRRQLQRLRPQTRRSACG